ncbi:MAG: CHAP domain-containing protein [Candidatus Protochlamydia sp.]|nr:CHAP domain-containing protein [Candidatus Protochlamydia sp.]
MEWGVSEKSFKESTYDPEPGDLVLFDRLLSCSELDHIGIVLENKSSYLVTSEGNVNNFTGIFKRKKDNKIRGYIRL